MLTGLFFIGIGVLMLLYPQLLAIMVSSLFILFGAGIMATSWQFRRLRRSPQSPFMNWIIRF